MYPERKRGTLKSLKVNISKEQKRAAIVRRSFAFAEGGAVFHRRNIVGFLVPAQFNGYRSIVNECSNREIAEKDMDSLYHLGDWASLFSVNHKRPQGGVSNMKYNGFCFLDVHRLNEKSFDRKI